LGSHRVGKMSRLRSIGFELSISGDTDGTLEAVYITVRDGKAHRTREIIEDIVLADYDDRGRLIGIEILAPVKLSKLTPLVEQGRRKPFRDFVKAQAPAELVIA